MSNKTFMMIKPDAVERGLIGKILNDISEAGFEIISLKLTHLSIDEAKSFYLFLQKADELDLYQCQIYQGVPRWYISNDL